MLRKKEQGKLHLSAFDQSIQDLALVSAERDILPIEVPVSSLYLSQQLTLLVLAITQQTPYTHVIGKQGQQQGILAISLEMFKAFPKVGTEQRVRLPFRHIYREMLTRLQLMTIPDVWIMFPAVQSLKVFHDGHGTLKRRQVRQPYPALSKDRLAEQAHHTE